MYMYNVLIYFMYSQDHRKGYFDVSMLQSSHNCIVALLVFLSKKLKKKKVTRFGLPLNVVIESTLVSIL